MIILTTILKVLLIVLIIVLALLLVLLFAPIRYEVSISYFNKITYTAKIKWILGIFSLTFSSNHKGYIISIFGKKQNRKEKAKNSQANIKKEQKEKEKKEEKLKEKIENEPKLNQQAKPENSSEFNEKQNNILTKINDIFKQIKYFKSYFSENEIKQIFLNTKLLIKRLIKAIKPSKFNAEGEFWLKTPESTGKALGALAIACSVFQLKNIAVCGSFEQKITNVKFYTKGKFTIWSILTPLVKYILIKPVWKLIKKYLLGKGE